MRKEPSARTLESWNKSIDELGRKLVRVDVILRQFGYERRSAVAVEKIHEWLRERSIYVNELTSTSPKLTDTVALTREKIVKLGDLYERELHLEEDAKEHIFPKLGLVLADRQYSPSGTRDKMDYLCRDADGRSVAVELKRDGGDRRGVEQVLRYIGQLKADTKQKHKDPWGVLITGRADAETRRALEGRDKDTHIKWYVYGKVAGRIELEEIPVSPQ